MGQITMFMTTLTQKMTLPLPLVTWNVMSTGMLRGAFDLTRKQIVIDVTVVGIGQADPLLPKRVHRSWVSL